ncbi:glutathione S-transferase [Tianweitania sediminis]|jgi:glutathione S-transferase|uniref:Glutathione S-transferase n=1 Tax=Tianweitania sediminis TaxID=1502156 RepID=A0A8J7QYG3_9HYPH|nr:glutathione S-transferase [Tianweitania sediminis]MBP0439028.1 glutathione S-transferase [Tianweitania sediminis]HEV7416730.1 glutathione S-transferase [Tianweitania sediminis]
MPKILYSPASPYSAKVRMAAAYVGLSFESELTETNAPPDSLLQANPLGKIPVLVTDEGDGIYDSRVITQYLNREHKGALFPRNSAKRLQAERLEALCDGLCDVLLAHVYERRMRPEEIVHQPWLDRQWRKAEQCLDLLMTQTPNLPAKLHAGHLAFRAALAYLALRFEGKWERGRSKLVRWAKRFDEKFPDLAALLPKA